MPGWVRVEKWAMRKTVSSCFSVSEQGLSMFKERRQRTDSELEELQDRSADGREPPRGGESGDPEPRGGTGLGLGRAAEFRGKRPWARCRCLPRWQG